MIKKYVLIGMVVVAAALSGMPRLYAGQDKTTTLWYKQEAKD